ncbi:MAG: hypothetical protein IPJ34_02970 [Myxococcales bacterium]|nr:hypothetical protein [Myxococcales bacterium]
MQIGDTHLSPPAELVGGSDAALYRCGPTAACLLREALRRGAALSRASTTTRASELLGRRAGATHALACVARAILSEGDEVPC